MLVDVRLAKIQTEYKREQLSRLYGKSQKRHQGEDRSVARRNPRRFALPARFSLLDR